MALTEVRKSRQPGDDLKWRAIIQRDSALDGTFVYGVKSTRVFCKPSCRSRRPLRSNVVFFATSDEALQSGFRECRKCGSEQALRGESQIHLIEAACRLIEDHIELPLTLEDLATRLAVSPFQLQRIFKKISGITPRQYAAAIRLKRFKERVRGGRDVTDSIYFAGYGSSRGLYERSNDALGMTPATYGRGGKGMVITYSMAGCRLGHLLVARTERGICSVSLGDDTQSLEETLKTEFSQADLHRDDQAAEDWTREIIEYLNGTPASLDLPVDIQATAFQTRVWSVLREIPYGETRSYGEIADILGQPSATRAVARACATNPVALINPCHRVVRSNGDLGGYRWGIDRKRKLLAIERLSKNDE